MESSSIYTWLQPQSPHNPVHHSPSTAQEWPKQQQQQPNPAASPQPTHQQPTLDLSEFTTLTDLPASSSSSTSAASPPSTQSSFYPFAHAGFYGGPPYYASGWPPTQPSQSPDPIPLSNYSTLNGATSANTASSSQSSQMVIDPALTTMNGSTSNGAHHQYSQPYPNQAQQQQQQRQPQLSQYPYLPPFPMAYYLPQQQQQHQQQQQQQQGTLSPHALHAPATNSMMNNMQFYSQQAQASGSKLQQQPQAQQQPPPGPTPQERKAALIAGIKPLLQPTAFTGAGAVQNLTQRLYDYGSGDVDAQTRLDILTKIRDGAGNHYFRAWAENPAAVDISREWLKAAFNAASRDDGDALLVETIMPLLHIIDRLPMSVESLKTSKLGKLVVKLVKDPPSPAIKDMASNVERRWRQLVMATEKQPEPAADDSKSRKRKPTDPPARPLPPLKKPATGSVRPVVKKEAAPASKPAAPAAAKSDSSFFSAPKPKPKLPSFKKAPPPPPAGSAKKDDANVAQPSAIDPFQEALKAMKTRRGSPLTTVATPPPGSGGEASANATPGYTRLGKRKKTVTWAPDGKLESVRLIERAIYGDENSSDGGVYSAHSLRDLDRSEGAALHMHLFEETVDWAEPLPIEIPEDLPDLGPRGMDSQEKTTQEQREQTALVSLYMSPSMVPDSPAEPTHVISDEEVDKDVREMTAGPEVDLVFWSSPPIPQQPEPAAIAPLASVADLVGQLAVGTPNQSADPVAQAQALPPEQLQALLLQLTAPGFPTPAPQQQAVQQQQQQMQGYGDWPGMNQFSADYSQGAVFPDDGGERNGMNGGGWPVRGGRGRGRGRGRGGLGEEGYRHNNKRRLCNFFAAGRCKFGDLCDYAHDIPPGTY